MITEDKYKLTADPLYRMSYLVKYSARVLHETLNTKLSKLTPNQWKTIAIIGSYPGISASRITLEIDIDKYGASRAINKLFEMGFLRRQTDEKDRRETRLYLTASGKKRFRDSSSIAKDIESRLFADLTRKEKDIFNGIISKLTERAVRMSEKISSGDRTLDTRP